MEDPTESKKWKGILGKTGRKGWFFVVSRFNYSYMIQLQFPNNDHRRLEQFETCPGPAKAVQHEQLERTGLSSMTRRNDKDDQHQLKQLKNSPTLPCWSRVVEASSSVLYYLFHSYRLQKTTQVGDNGYRFLVEVMFLNCDNHGISPTFMHKG